MGLAIASLAQILLTHPWPEFLAIALRSLAASFHKYGWLPPHLKEKADPDGATADESCSAHPELAEHEIEMLKASTKATPVS